MAKDDLRSEVYYSGHTLDMIRLSYVSLTLFSDCHKPLH